MSLTPFDLEEAREAERLAAAQQEGGEGTLRDASKELAEKERAYRLALAQAITTLRAEGNAATVCADLARGDKQVADLRYHRDVAQGVLDAAQQAAWRFAANRKAVGRITEWSARREIAEHGGPDSRLGLAA